MKTFLRSNLIAALIGIASTLYAQVASAPVLAPAPGAWSESPYVPGEVLVKFKPTAGAQERVASVAAQGHTLIANLSQPGWSQVKLVAGQTVESALVAYKNDPTVEFAQPNYIYHATLFPNDPQYAQLWAFKNNAQTINNSLTQPPSSPLFPTHNPGATNDDMNIDPAWGHITDCSSVVVAVVDSGVN